MEIPEFLRGPFQASQETEELRELYEAYEEQFGELDWDGYIVAESETIETEKEAIRQCLKEGKHMEEIRPEWCIPLPPYTKQ